MFQISSQPIEQQDLRQGLLSPDAGALSTFEGWVRNHNEGRTVIALEYDVYESLCLKEAQAIFQEAYEKSDIIAAKCVHRSGRLMVGDLAVWVGVTAAHRDASFQACRYIIDQVKVRLPIWKKEFYENGGTGWVACQTCAGYKTPAPP